MVLILLENKELIQDISGSFFEKMPRHYEPGGSGEHSHLLLHLLNLPDRAAALGSVLVAQEVDVEVSRLAKLLLLLFLSILQLALRADALRVIHVIRLHHLQEDEKVRRMMNNASHARVIPSHSFRISIHN